VFCDDHGAEKSFSEVACEAEAWPPHRGGVVPRSLDAFIHAIEALVKHGAKWKPEGDSVRDARRRFRHLEPGENSSPIHNPERA